jgi:uncharacterized integral membrane protein
MRAKAPSEIIRKRFITVLKDKFQRVSSARRKGGHFTFLGGVFGFLILILLVILIVKANSDYRLHEGDGLAQSIKP